MKRISPDTLKKYQEGKCTPEEAAQVEAWFRTWDNEPDDTRLLNVQESEQLKNSMLAKIKSSIGEDSLPKEQEKPTRWFLKIAAGLSAVIMVSFGLYYASFRKNSEAEIDPAFTRIVNTTDAILRQELADGSMIWLRPQSSIEFRKIFMDDKREVTLSGEAFFDVAKDASRPFIITTDKVTTQVLGTSFNIRAYDKAPSIEVSVLTGKVSVQIKDELNARNLTSVLLTPHQRVTYSKEKNAFEREEKTSLPELSIWQSTNVVFDNVKISEVLTTLNKKFGVVIRARNKNLLNCHIRADFTNQNLPDILELLSQSVEASYEFKNDTIFLDGEGCIDQ